MDYVIVGNSAAAVGCVEGIRSVDQEGKITVLSQEPYHTYSRPLISYLLEGKTDLERMKYRPDSFYEELGCDVKLGVTVTEISPEEHQVKLFHWRGNPLRQAAGSHRLHPLRSVHGRTGNGGAEIHLSFPGRRQGAGTGPDPESRVLILGAGLIGLKCAEGTAAGGLSRWRIWRIGCCPVFWTKGAKSGTGPHGGKRLEILPRR